MERGEADTVLITIPQIDRALHDSDWADEKDRQRDHANAKFIAACSPDVIAALVAEVRLQRRQLDDALTTIRNLEAARATAYAEGQRAGLEQARELIGTHRCDEQESDPCCLAGLDTRVMAALRARRDTPAPPREEPR